MEKKQSFWWYLFVAGVLALLVEAVLANRLSERLMARFQAPGRA
jgi:hypothetical protein